MQIKTHVQLTNWEITSHMQKTRQVKLIRVKSSQVKSERKPVGHDASCWLDALHQALL